MALKRFLSGFTTNIAQTDAEADDSQLRPRQLSVPVVRAAEIVQSIATDKPCWKLTARIEKGPHIEIHLTRQTRVFRFVDDIQATLISEPNGTRVEVRSQSRVGKGDLGQNRRNIGELMSYIDDQLSNST